MPVCQNCNQTWSWKQTSASSFTLDTGMVCPYCGEKQYETTSTKRINTVTLLITITIIGLMNLFFGPSLLFLIVLAAAYPVLIALYPFWVQLSNTEQSFW
jgi:CXXC-20-CXXC protein